MDLIARKPVSVIVTQIMPIHHVYVVVGFGGWRNQPVGLPFPSLRWDVGVDPVNLPFAANHF